MKLKHMHYGWVMVIGAILMLGINGSGYSFGVFIKPLTQQFGWERGALSIASSLALVVSGVLSIFVGRLCDKYGPRLLSTAAIFFMGIGLLLMSRISELWQVYLIYGCIIGVGSSAYIVPIITTIPRWFEKKRGMAIGFTMTGIGLGGVIGPLAAQWFIEAFDWRWAYMLLGIVALVVCIPLAQLMKRDPAQIGLRPYGAEDDSNDLTIHSSASRSSTEGISYRQALKSMHFWLTSIILFCSVFILQVVCTHLPPHAIDIGIPETVAASFVSMFSFASLAGRSSCGVITDRIGARRMMLIAIILTATGTVWLLFANKVWMLYLYTIVGGVSWGLTTPLQVLMPTELFGLKALGSITATLMLIGMIGGAMGPPIAGAVFDVTGDYRTAFFICIGLATLAIVLAITSLLLRIKKV